MDAEVAPLQLHPPVTLITSGNVGGRRGLCLERTRERLVMLWLPGRESAGAAGSFDANHPWIAHLLRALHLRERVEKASLHSSALDASVERVNLARRWSVELPLHIPRDGRPPLAVLLSPQVDPACWMAVLCDPESAPDFDLDLIAADLGVTLREAEVAADLCRGLPPQQIAARLGISINTVRSHVKAIYGKTGTHSRVALIRRIATSPAALLRRK